MNTLHRIRKSNHLVTLLFLVVGQASLLFAGGMAAGATERWLVAATVTLLTCWVMRLMLQQHRRELVATKRAARAPDPLQKHLLRAVANLNDVVWTIEVPSHKSIYVSPGVKGVLGVPARAYFDDPLRWIREIHPDDVGRVMEAAARIPQSMRENLMFRHVMPGGEMRFLQCRASFIAGDIPGSGWIDGITTDITEQHATRQALLRSNRALRAIRACDEVIAAATEEKKLYQGVCDVMVDAGYRMAWAGLIQPSGTILAEGIAGERDGEFAHIAAALENGGQLSAVMEQAIQSQRAAVETKILRSARCGDLRQRSGWHSKMAIPLVHAEHVIGLLNVYALDDDAFDEEEVSLLSGLAQSVTAALQLLRQRNAVRDAEAALHLRQRALEACANPIAITSVTQAGRAVEYVNPAFERITGYKAHEVGDREFGLLIGEDRDQPGIQDLQAGFREQREAHAVLREYREDGSMFWSDIYIAPVRDERREVTHFVAVRYDITANKAFEAELAFQATHDVLTGLANRSLLQDRLNQAIAHSKRYKHGIWVMMLDLDGFSLVNDTLGHEAGDRMLQKVAVQLRGIVRQTDTVARASGDKFVLVMSEVGYGSASVTTTVQRIMESVGQPFSLHGQDYFVTCSVGIAVYPADGDRAETLLMHADVALGRAKEARPNNFEFFTREMNASAAVRFRLQGDLRGALKRGELTLHYQPQLNLRTGRIVGMEALLRWQHPELGLVPPSEFVPIAEETGLIIGIGIWVLRTACEYAASLHAAGHTDLRIAVNLSPRQFEQEDLVASIAEILAATGLAPAFLDIELTETLIMADVSHVIQRLHQLKALGVKISIDDFGTGHSSLSYLSRFPIDVLKIDRSFITSITSDPGQTAIILSIISLAHHLRLQVVAEGVETEEQLGFLQRHRCEKMQGYFFSPAVPGDVFLRMLEEGRGIASGTDGTTPQPTLLVLDDETHITAAVQRLLRRDGYRIIRAHSPEEALRLLALNDVQVVLSDQRMPSMSGIEFLTRAKKLYPYIVPMILSGYTGVESIIDSLNSGVVFRFHTKPWDNDVLRESIAEAFRFQWLMRSQPHAGLPAPPLQQKEVFAAT